MDFKGFVMDHMGHFSMNDLPNKLFAVLVAAFLGHALGRWGARLALRTSRELAVWAALAALAISFVRTQLPLAVALLALMLVARGGPEREDAPTRSLVLGAAVLGMGCGGGAALATLLLSIPFIMVVRWAHATERP